ncbi:MAG: class I SAM-dependent methyltransferase [Candidatus Sungbacteria bacterium]|nr:class I SAM-dependent methyltransferase [Candidatus Sungbacteria bacterium]
MAQQLLATADRCQAWVDLYDTMDAQVDGGDDREFYLNLLQDVVATRGVPCSVLELGVGTGRVLHYLAGRTERTIFVGIDASAPMLAVAKHKLMYNSAFRQDRVTLIKGDMRNAADILGGSEKWFDMAYIAFNSFQCLLTPEDQERCLRAVHQSLRHGGILAISIFDPNLELCLPKSSWPRLAQEVVHPATGRPWKIFVDSRHNDPERQVFHEQWRFVELNYMGNVINVQYGSLLMRWTYRYEMQHLLRCCGFKILNLFGDYDRGPFEYGGRQIWVVQKLDLE